MQIFDIDKDYNLFEETLKEAKDKFDMRIRSIFQQQKIAF
jgi:hypothetical protein